jgi:hypothetical protein
LQAEGETPTAPAIPASRREKTMIEDTDLVYDACNDRTDAEIIADMEKFTGKEIPIVGKLWVESMMVDLRNKWLEYKYQEWEGTAYARLEG